MRALFLGRFQPFHNGHLHVLRQLVKEFSDVVIVIGSKQCSREEKNPFSYDERKEMILEVLKAEGMKNVTIFGVEDINCDNHYVKHLESRIPKCDAFFAGNELTKRLFKEAGYDVRELPRYFDISGTQVRRLMSEGGDWESLVPSPVANFIKQDNDSR